MQLETTDIKPVSVLNFNVGLLGHVDSGKTSLAKAISTTASTACFDKNPQSKERGITIDLGFSSFAISLPEHLIKDAPDKSVLQYTLVDCPGHASLIKTIIGGAQIIDLMILVIDVTKGMQTQTAECLIIGEITCNHMIIVLNKCDLLPQDKREAMIGKMTKRMLKTLEKTKFADCPIVPVSANPESTEEAKSQGIDKLVEELAKASYVPKRKSDGPFIFSVDHCFVIRGQGTIMTGTMLRGCVKLNDNVEIPQLKVTKKVKSIQMFRKPVEKIFQGDRAGICVTQFDPSTLERGIICSPGSVQTLFGVILEVSKISYFKGKCLTKSKFHISLGHETVMAKVHFFSSQSAFSIDDEYYYEDELLDESNRVDKRQYGLLEFEHSVVTASQSLAIGSKLDTDIHSNTCRLAFQGPVVMALTDKMYKSTILPSLKIYKNKLREGVVERMVNEQEVICKNLFKKETDLDKFCGLKVSLSTGEEGVIEGNFGQSGKIKIAIRGGLLEETVKILSEYKKKKGKGNDVAEAEVNKQLVTVSLKFKRFIYDPNKKMMQS